MFIFEARRAVDSLRTAGVDFVKAYEGLELDVFFAAAAEARRIGIPFVGHLGKMIDIEASDSGQRSIEHVVSLTKNPCWYVPMDSVAWRATPAPPSAECLALGKRFARNQTWLVPTLVTSAMSDIPTTCPASSSPLPLSKFTRLQRMVERLHQMGMPLLAATDANAPDPPEVSVASAPGPVAGCSLHQELIYLTQSGLTPLAALQTATLNPAEFLNATDSLGSIAPGKLADLVVLDADPLVNISHTQQIRAVIADGRYFDRGTLDHLAATIDDGRER